MSATVLERPTTDTADSEGVTHEPSCCFPRERLCGIATAGTLEAPETEPAGCPKCRMLLTIGVALQLPCRVLRQLR